MINYIRIKKLDWYIIRKFLGTYIFSLSIIIAISIVFDISEKIDDFIEEKAPLKEIVFNYYLNFIPFFAILFSALFTFISVIFFTSRMAYQTEIIAILSAGVSFRRLLYPYMLSALVIALFTYSFNNFVLPRTNKVKFEFERKYIEGGGNSSYRYSNVHKQIRPGIYVYMDNFSTHSNIGYKVWVEKYDGTRLVSRLIADRASWDSTTRKWALHNYFVRDIQGFNEKIKKGILLDTNLYIKPNEFNYNDNRPENMNYHQLNNQIRKLKLQGSEDLVDYQVERQRRASFAMSTFILTLIGMTLSSKKTRGGIGLNIGLGLLLTFSYILFDKFASQFAINGTMPVLVAVWMPNFIYLLIAIYLYWISPK